MPKYTFVFKLNLKYKMIIGMENYL